MAASCIIKYAVHIKALNQEQLICSSNACFFSVGNIPEVDFWLMQVKLQRLQQEYVSAQAELKRTRQSAAVDIQNLHQLADSKISQLQVCRHSLSCWSS